MPKATTLPTVPQLQPKRETLSYDYMVCSSVCSTVVSSWLVATILCLASIPTRSIFIPGILPYKCEICDKMFSRKTGLKSHEEVAHGLVDPGASGLKSIEAPFSGNLVGSAGDEEAFFAVEEAVEGDQLHVGDIILT